ncbi:MAG: hypothetical protein IJY57_05155 [Clostridia bacterium]|nr:hypothetical protein [Clostridia bacterium]
MIALSIISFIIGIIVYLCAGFVCGRICVEIVRKKEVGANEVLWFWAGFLLNFIAVFMTLVLKKNDSDK